MSLKKVNEEKNEGPKEDEDEISYEIKNQSFFHIRKELLPLKLALFFYYGAMSAMLPFLTLHMQHIGITINEVAVISAVLPFTSFAGPPVIGFLADKLGQYNSVLIFVTFANGLFHMMLLFVPTYSETPIMSNISLFYLQSSNHTSIFPVIQENCQAFIKDLDGNSIENGLNNLESQLKISQCVANERMNFELSTTAVNLINWEPEQKSEMSKLNCTDSSEIDNFNCIYKDPEKEEMAILKYKPKKSLKDSSDDQTFNISNCLYEIEITFPLKSQLANSNNGIICQTNRNFPTGELEIVGSSSFTFWLYFILRIIATLFTNSCFSLLDATTLALVKKMKGVYGRERIWSILGLATIAPIAGLLVDKFETWRGFLDYSPAFVFANLLLIVNIVIYYSMKLEVEKPDDDYIKNGRKLLKYPEVVAFLIFMFLLGSMWGFVESYLFVFLRADLSAEAFFLGLTVTIGSLAGIPVLFLSGQILLKVGRINIIVIAFLSYFVRYFGYAYIENFWFALPYEAMEAFTYHLMWVAAATYCLDLAPKGLLATLVGIMGSIHFSLGRGNGSFFGGFLYGAYGARLAFKYFGVISGVIGVLYYVINVVWLDKVVKKRANENRDKGDKSSKFNEENVQQNAEMMVMIGKGNSEKDTQEDVSKIY